MAHAGQKGRLGAIGRLRPVRGLFQLSLVTDLVSNIERKRHSITIIRPSIDKFDMRAIPKFDCLWPGLRRGPAVQHLIHPIHGPHARQIGDAFLNHIQHKLFIADPGLH